MLICSVITLFAGVGFSVATFGLSLRALRRLVGMEFESHHEAWVRDGRPPGVVSTWGRAQLPISSPFFPEDAYMAGHAGRVPATAPRDGA